MPIYSQSRLAARLQNLVSKRREEVGLYKEIADKLPLEESGRLLDVGTGSGLQLKVIHVIKPGIALFGLDISSAAIHVARANLEGLDVDLQQGSIESTTYENDFFDLVTCHASMSYWDDPSSCFDEIFRILKPGGLGILFEPQKEINLKEVAEIIDANLAGKSMIRRFMARNVNIFGLRYGHLLGLNTYSVGELEEIARRSRFGEHYSLKRETLQNLPIFVRITLIKPIKAGT